MPSKPTNLRNWVSELKINHYLMKKLLIGMVFSLLLLVCANSAIAVVYVDQDRPGGDGSSWETAYKTIVAAITGSGESQEFWVAEGTYVPGSPITPKPGSQFYGGFAGNETARDQRDISAYITTLDGQNSLIHVIYINSLATNIRIDGFVVKRGNATSGSGFDKYGGGLFANLQSVIIANCTFEENASETQGGAVFVNRAAATVQNCKFQTNSSGHGGGVAGYQSNLIISGCEFNFNTAVGNGGGVYNDEASTGIEASVFSRNSAGTRGGGISVARGPATVRSCEFSNNNSAWGGAVAGYDSDMKISNCQFDTNRADLGEQPRGGAVYLDLNTPEIENSKFENNTAGWTGGAVELNATVDAVMSGCDFLNNNTERAGGALAGSTSGEGSATISKCIFKENSCLTGGGGIYSYQFHFVIQQCMFQGNTAGDGGGIMLDYKLDSPSRIERCLFLNNSASAIGGGGLYCFARSVVVENSVFAYNTAPNGGAMWMHAGDGSHFDPNFTVTLRNSTFYGNSAQMIGGEYGYGGAMMNTDVLMAYLYNCIFWGNQAEADIWDGAKYITTPDVFNGGNTSSMTTRYIDMETLDWKHWSKSESHIGSFSADPLFEDPDGVDNIEGTLDDNFHLTMESPCLDHADGDNAPALDMDFEARRDLVGVPNLGTGTPPYGDLGPYETQPVSFVNKNDGTCGGKVPCYTSIQGAIDAATDGATIKIVQGDYAEAIILSTSKDLSLKAGWDSAFTTQSSTSGIQSLTISDGKMKTEYLVIR